MEHLFTLKDFPVSLSCVAQEIKNIKKLYMIFEICKINLNFYFLKIYKINI